MGVYVGVYVCMCVCVWCVCVVCAYACFVHTVHPGICVDEKQVVALTEASRAHRPKACRCTD